jgi:VanZ family protein
MLDFFRIDVASRTFLILHFSFRKLGHITEYAILSCLIYISLHGGRQLAWHTRTAIWCVLAAGLYSLTDEFHQLFVPGRTGSLMDCGIDAAGASLGMLVIYGTERFFPGEKQEA